MFEILLPEGVTIEDAIVVLAACSSLAVVTLVWFALLPADPGIKRARFLAQQRQAMRAGLTGPLRRRREQSTSSSFMHQVVNQLKLMRSNQTEKIVTRLTQAGWRSKDALVKYLFMKLALPFIFGGIAVFLVFGLELYDLDMMRKTLACLGAVVLGAYMPDIVTKNAAQKRQEKMRKSLPDALDLMVICAEAGLSLDSALSRVSKEIEKNDPELADELGLTGLELGFLPDRQTALKNLANRTNFPIMRGLVNTLLQSERYGTPVAHSLRVISTESRDERMMKAEEKAARLPAMLTVPMIVFILPPLFVVLIGPAVLSTMDALSGI
ncbi:MAG TPA: type II secretion system F family protein [Kiloniellaceae bacterium]|nr:type II secretion system F family protein [Kiloniellaceae bacterium]